MIILFQSSPGFGAGRYAMVTGGKSGITCFNPRPALEPGATYTALFIPTICSRFQSSPGFGAGRYITNLFALKPGEVFQSSPGFGAGRYVQVLYLGGQRLVFQSSPGFGAGRYTKF